MLDSSAPAIVFGVLATIVEFNCNHVNIDLEHKKTKTCALCLIFCLHPELMVKDPAKRLGHMGADDILRHQWFGHLDLDALAMDQVESPYIPTKDINAAPQRAIGSFADAGSKVMTEYC